MEMQDIVENLKRSTAVSIHASRQQVKYQESMLRLVSMDMFEDMHNVLDERQLGLLETLETIRNEKLSFARFGDGEFLLMLKAEFNIRFQKNSPALQQAMRDALLFAADNEDKLLVGYPHIFQNQHWTGVFSDVWPMMKKYAINFSRLGNSHISRPLAFEVLGNDACNAWKSLWSGENIVVVTGRGSRFDLEPALFADVASAEFVYSEPAHAFVDLPRLIKELKGLNPQKVLISLGPAGSLLAVELARVGIQGLDIGHLSSSYRNVMAGGRFPEDTPFLRS